MNAEALVALSGSVGALLAGGAFKVLELRDRKRNGDAWAGMVSRYEKQLREADERVAREHKRADAAERALMEHAAEDGAKDERILSLEHRLAAAERDVSLMEQFAPEIVRQARHTGETRPAPLDAMPPARRKP